MAHRKSWKKSAPHLISERRALLARCGRRAFLQPSKLKYPIMAKHGPCVVSCTGLRAALSRAARFSPTTAKKAKRAAARAHCAWS